MRLRVLVRGRKDAKAAAAALNRFYPGFDYEVAHLGGLRGEALAAEALERASPFTLLLLPERCAQSLDASRLPPYSRLVTFKARDLRNLRVEQIASLIDRGRALLRLSAEWDRGRGAYRLDSPELPRAVEASPDSDVTVVYSWGLEALGEALGVKLSGHALAYIHGGRILAHYAGEPVGVLDVEAYPPRPLSAAPPPTRGAGGLWELLEASRGALLVAVESIVEWMGERLEGAERVLVPWSGGKDSTAALLLAVAATGPDRVTAVHVDTGVEFPESIEYVERVASRLGVEAIRVEARLYGEIRARGLPRRGERWCTGLKLEALARAVRRLARGRTVVVVGDRDAESRARSRRPPVRLDPYHGLETLAPIKLLGAAHALLIPMLWGIEPNRLYAEGFYRIGCFICPYMSGWELWLLERGLYRRLSRARADARDLIEGFIRARTGNYLPGPP